MTVMSFLFKMNTRLVFNRPLVLMLKRPTQSATLIGIRPSGSTQVRYVSGNVDPTKRKEDKLHKIISKSRLLTRLNRNPKFSHYFDRLSEAGTVPTLTSFFILHEVTAIPVSYTHLDVYKRQLAYRCIIFLVT